MQNTKTSMTSSHLHQSLSVAEYIKTSDLSELINASVNACAAHRPHPSLVPAFLSQHFHAQHFESPAAVAIDGITLSTCGLDGTGTPQLELTLSLVDGRAASALVAHSCGMSAIHPSTSRTNKRSTLDTRQRTNRAKAVRDLVVNLNSSSNNNNSSNDQKLLHILCNAICGSSNILPVSSNTTSGIANNIATGVSAGSGDSSKSSAISAAKPLQDFDLVLASADGSTNFSVLGSNIAAAASIAFCKLRSQIHRTPLGLNQPLYRLLAKDFAFLEANSVSNTAQLVTANGDSGNSSATVLGSQQQQQQQQQRPNSSSNVASGNVTFAQGNSNNNNNNGASTSLFNIPLPLVPLFSGADAPVFGKLRILKQVVIFPNPKIYFSSNSNSDVKNNRNKNDIGRVLHELQLVVNTCFEKLSTDETTQQPAIMLPHQGGVMKHVALETFASVIEFVEECIKEALPQYFATCTATTTSNTNAEKSTKDGSANNNNAASMINNNNSSKHQQQLDILQQQQILPTGLSSDVSPILIGLILDGSACSMRGSGNNNSDDFYFGAAAVESSSTSKAAAAKTASGNQASTSKQQQGASSPTKNHPHNNNNNNDVSTATAGGTKDKELLPQQQPPKYFVIDGAPEWTAAQLSDHLAALCATKPLVKYIQDSHREDQGGPTGEFMNDSWRRLVSRLAHMNNYTNPPPPPAPTADAESAPVSGRGCAGKSTNPQVPSPPPQLQQPKAPAAAVPKEKDPQLVSIAGDELFCSNQSVIERLAPEAVCNTLVVRITDAGTVTRAMNCARCFRSIVPNGSICVAPEVCDNESARSGFVVDFAFAIGATFINLNSSVLSSAGCQGAAMLTRYQAIVNELEVVAAEKADGNGDDDGGDMSGTADDQQRNRNFGVNSNNNDSTKANNSRRRRRKLFSYPSSLPDYTNTRNVATEPIEPLGLLEMVINPKDQKKKR